MPVTAVFNLVCSRLLPIAAVSLSLTACLGGGDGSPYTGGTQAAMATGAAPAPARSGGSTTGNAAPQVGGVPAASIPAGFPYVFRPIASDPDGDSLTFSIRGLPTWATFDPRTGELRGTPTEADIGESGGIVITVSDGQASATLGPFSVRINRPANGVTPSSGGQAPSISGTPPTTVAAGAGYTFRVIATDPEGDRLTYGATNLPAWLGLNSANGILTGTPTAAQVGTYPNITISVTDGSSTVSLPPFTITVTAAPGAAGSSTNTGAGKVGTATLSWLKPTQNADGTPLTDLAGYIVKYGNSSSELHQSIAVNDPAMTRYTVSNLGSGTWYFTVVSYTVSGLESSHSEVVSKTIG
ncbi:MAG: putative Ig domain-containing protein [Steroidobacteraceae bacterium]|nr:putative Ig domain-containing protein [Nevskiaceae bacterium]MCP5339382.1 putative Ig domain-containing protein [Nevskiaceae bacterium]MCP5471338.1 putative Ig domain-containing protein [Nevskiaceae bacterium]